MCKKTIFGFNNMLFLKRGKEERALMAYAYILNRLSRKEIRNLAVGIFPELCRFGMCPDIEYRKTCSIFFPEESVLGRIKMFSQQHDWQKFPFLALHIKSGTIDPLRINRAWATSLIGKT